jgi:hypothetical protein
MTDKKKLLFFDIVSFDGKFWEVTTEDSDTIDVFFLLNFSYYKNNELNIVVWKIRDDDYFIDKEMRKIFDASEAKTIYEFNKNLKDLINES